MMSLRLPKKLLNQLTQTDGKSCVVKTFWIYKNRNDLSGVKNRYKIKTRICLVIHRLKEKKIVDKCLLHQKLLHGHLYSRCLFSPKNFLNYAS